MLIGLDCCGNLKKRFCDLFATDQIRVQVEFSDNDRACYDERTHRYTDEKYRISVRNAPEYTKVRLICSSEKSAFYGLSDLERRIGAGNLEDADFECAPYFSLRGYIEGFYGTPWSSKARLSVLRTAAQEGMNAYFYAPKNDDYHRTKWRKPYPDSKLSEFKELIDTATGCYMELFWCFSPGLDIRYSDPKDLKALITKTEQLYNIGVTSFGLLLDDIPDTLSDPTDKERYGELVNAQIDLINRYHNALRAVDPAIRLAVCPTLYHGRGDEYYISKLGSRLPPEILLFWTGRDICSRDLTSDESRRFLEHTTHRPLYWDNYPVNDEAMHFEMHLGPVINRDPDLWRYASGVIANCMPYPEATKIPLITYARYLWDGPAYDAESAWRNAIRAVVGREDAAPFLLFADHLRQSHLRDKNSGILLHTFSAAAEASRAGEREKASRIVEDYIAQMKAGLKLLSTDLPLFIEIAPWIEKYRQSCPTLEKLFKYLLTRDETLPDSINKEICALNRIPEKLIIDNDLLEVIWGRYF